MKNNIRGVSTYLVAEAVADQQNPLGNIREVHRHQQEGLVEREGLFSWKAPPLDPLALEEPWWRGVVEAHWPRQHCPFLLEQTDLIHGAYSVGNGWEEQGKKLAFYKPLRQIKKKQKIDSSQECELTGKGGSGTRFQTYTKVERTAFVSFSVLCSFKWRVYSVTELLCIQYVEMSTKHIYFSKQTQVY